MDAHPSKVSHTVCAVTRYVPARCHTVRDRHLREAGSCLSHPAQEGVNGRETDGLLIILEWYALDMDVVLFRLLSNRIGYAIISCPSLALGCQVHVNVFRGCRGDD